MRSGRLQNLSLKRSVGLFKCNQSAVASNQSFQIYTENKLSSSVKERQGGQKGYSPDFHLGGLAWGNLPSSSLPFMNTIHKAYKKVFDGGPLN